MVIIYANTPEEINQAFALVLALEKGNEDVSEKRAMTNAERCKKYRDRKKQASTDTMSVSENVNDTKEEREEKEGVLPLSSPSSLPSSPSDSPINYPITPYNPPLPEEKGEREESDSAKRPKPTKHQHGEYRHVLLTDEEFQKLADKFPDVGARIKRLDEYLENNKKKHYDNHYLTIIKWAEKDEAQKPQSKSFADIARELNDQTPKWDIEI